MRPIKRSAEKTLERASEKFFRAVIFGFGLLAAAAFAYYAGVLPLPIGWKISPSPTIQYEKSR
jgi:hypothetical protein